MPPPPPGSIAEREKFMKPHYISTSECRFADAIEMRNKVRVTVVKEGCQGEGRYREMKKYLINDLASLPERPVILFKKSSMSWRQRKIE